MLFTFVAVGHALSPAFQVADSRLSVPVAYAVVHSQTLALEHVPSVSDALAETRYDVVTDERHTLPFFPWPPMLLAVPGVVAFELAGADVSQLRPSSPNETWRIEVPTAAFLVAAATVVMALIASDTVGDRNRGRRYAVIVALTFAFATSAWSTASRALWQHTPAMLCWALALLAAVRAARGSRYLWLLGTSLALGFTMRPTGAVPLVALGAWALLEFRSRVWRVVVGGTAVLALFVAVNVVAYGRPLPPYYAGTRLGSEALIGFGESLAVQLVSPSRGLFVYTPLFLLVPLGLYLKRRAGGLTRLDLAVSATLVVHWVVVSGYGSTGGASYGSRFFTEAVPFLVYLCLPVAERVLTSGEPSRYLSIGVGVLAATSCLMTAPGALTRSAYCWSATPAFIDEAPERVWEWSDPQFLRSIGRWRAGDSLRSVVVGSCGPERSDD